MLVLVTSRVRDQMCSHHISDGGFSLSVVANMFPTIVAPLKKGNLQGPPMDWVCNVRNTCFARYPCFIFVPNEYMFYQIYMFYTCFKMNTCLSGIHVLHWF